MSTTSQTLRPQSRAPFRVPFDLVKAPMTGLIARRPNDGASRLGAKGHVNRRSRARIWSLGNTHHAPMARDRDNHVQLKLLGSKFYPLLGAAALVAATTLGLLLAGKALETERVTIVFLIPVLICATRWGFVPALVAEIIGIGADGFIIEPRAPAIVDLQLLADVTLFAAVAAIVSDLAARLRLEIAKSGQREKDIQLRDREIGALHRFCRKLMASGMAHDVYSAIQSYFLKELRIRTVIIGASNRIAPEIRSPRGVDAPETVHKEACRLLRGMNTLSQVVFDKETRHHWLVRPVSSRAMDYGVIAADLGCRPRETVDTVSRMIEAALIDAAAMLEHLEVARLIQEADASQRKLSAGC